MSNQPGWTIIAERDKKLRAARKLFFGTIEGDDRSRRLAHLKQKGRRRAGRFV